MPKLPTLAGELGAAIRRGRSEGRLGPEHRLDIVRARILAAMIADPATPRSAVAPLDRRLDVILERLGFVQGATGPTELDDWLSGLAGEELEPDAELEGEGADAFPAEDLGDD